MSYQILRIKKLKTFRAIKGSAAHNFREMKVINADPARQYLNKTIGAKTGDELVKIWQGRVNAGLVCRNKTTVKMVEFLITASPQFFEHNNLSSQYLKESAKWLAQKFGKNNVISLNWQFDEKTPHLVAYVIPEFQGKLNAKHFFGSTSKLRSLQNDFHKNVAQKFQLERGLIGSKTKHQKVKRFYSFINQPQIMMPTLPSKNFLGQFNTSEVEDFIQKCMNLGQLIQQNRNLIEENRKLKSIKRTAEKAQEENQKFERMHKALSDKNNQLMLIMEKMILNFDIKTKAKVAKKLSLNLTEPLIEQLKHGPLMRLSKNPAHDAIDMILETIQELNNEIFIDRPINSAIIQQEATRASRPINL